MSVDIQDVLDYWHSEQVKPAWFNSTPALDAEITDRFESTWQSARAGVLDDWCHSPDGCLALAIVLDQFPLNMFRGRPQSFATEQQAVSVTLHAVDVKFDQRISRDRLAFLYMPLMHSENADHQALSVQLFEAAGLSENARFARHHQQIIQRFGRFPHRNDILARTSHPDELAYLASDEAFQG